jgi:hypothetical protein
MDSLRMLLHRGQRKAVFSGVGLFMIGKAKSDLLCDVLELTAMTSVKCGSIPFGILDSLFEGEPQFH